MRRHLVRIAPDVTNAAVGGASTRDLAGQAGGAAIESDDVVVVSVGSNDAAPWKQVPLEEFTRLLATFLADLPTRRVV